MAGPCCADLRRPLLIVMLLLLPSPTHSRRLLLVQPCGSGCAAPYAHTSMLPASAPVQFYLRAPTYTMAFNTPAFLEQLAFCLCSLVPPCDYRSSVVSWTAYFAAGHEWLYNARFYSQPVAGAEALASKLMDVLQKSNTRVLSAFNDAASGCFNSGIENVTLWTGACDSASACTLVPSPPPLTVLSPPPLNVTAINPPPLQSPLLSNPTTAPTPPLPSPRGANVAAPPSPSPPALLPPPSPQTPQPLPALPPPLPPPPLPPLPSPERSIAPAPAPAADPRVPPGQRSSPPRAVVSLPPRGSSSALQTGVIVGSTVGVFAATAAVLVVVWRRRRAMGGLTKAYALMREGGASASALRKPAGGNTRAMELFSVARAAALHDA